MPVPRDDWCEGELCFDFSEAMAVAKLDGSDHGLSHCMKSVDFVVEWPDQYWLIELKDPEESVIPPQHQEQARERFAKDFSSGKLLDEHLFPKFKHSLIYLGMDRGIPAKPLRYVALIALSTLEPAQLQALAEAFKKKKPWIMGPRRGWAKSFDFAAFTCDEWNRSFPHCPVRRSSHF